MWLWTIWLFGVVIGGIAAAVVGFRRTPQARAARGECPCCGYSLVGISAEVCPECGGGAQQCAERSARDVFRRRTVALVLPAAGSIASAVPLLGVGDPRVLLLGAAVTMAPFGFLGFVAWVLAPKLTLTEMVLAVGCGTAAGAWLLLYAYIGAMYWASDARSGLVLLYGPIVAFGLIGLGFGAGLGVGSAIGAMRRR
jgi:hypothetical protein